MKLLNLVLILSITFLFLDEPKIIAEEIPMKTNIDTIKNIFNFDNEDDTSHWVSVNDNVMGGISKGAVVFGKDSSLVFAGSLSLENNGGFASIRTLPRFFDLEGYHGIRIKIMGDGREYQFRILTDKNYVGIAFKHNFKTKENTWQIIDLPFELFIPVYRGRILNNIMRLSPSDIKQFGFLIADKTPGPFNLIVDSISAYK